MTAHLSASISPTTRARLAHLMGFPPAESPRRGDDDDDWYIPYNGPIEPPREEDVPRGRTRAASTATRKSYASSQFTRSFYGGGGIGEAPVHTAASARDRMSTYSTYSRDVEWERERDREGDREHREHRGSIASFLTFGHGARKDSGFVFPRPRRSEEARVQGRSGEGRSEEPSHPPQRVHTPFHQHPQSQMQPRSAALSLTAADRERGWGARREGTARDSMEVSAPLRASGSQDHRSREPQREWFDTEEPEEEDTSWEEHVPQQTPHTIAHSTSQPVLPVAPRHPYAVAFPRITHEPPPARHLYPPGPTHTATNSHSTTTSASSKPSSKPSSGSSMLHHNIHLHLRPSPSAPLSAPLMPLAPPAPPAPARTLRPSALSTPNLRAFQAKPKPTKSKMQYAAETWCDALMFPRPRFRAHVVSPPTSPEDDRPPAHVLRRTASAKMLPRPDYFTPRERERAYPIADPHPKKLPPPPAPLSPAEETLKRVLAEGAQRTQEREVWSTVASTSFQNGRSRSLSRTRSRKRSGAGRVRVESERGLAGALAAEAFRQPTPTISVSVSAGSAAHSRNTSQSVSGQGHGSAAGHGHARGASWGKVALKICDGQASPEERLAGALMSEKTARLSVRGRREEDAEAEVQFVDIVPQVPVRPRTAPAQNAGERAHPYASREHSYASHEHSYASREHSYASDALDVPAVGIALSTPPHPSPAEDLPDLSAHPYAQPSRRPEPAPVSAQYAGPHPTARDYAWERYRGEGSPGAYAYADVDASAKRESTLGVEEVLMSRTFQRGTEGVWDAYDAPPTPPRVRHKPPALPVPSLSHTATTAAHTSVPDAAGLVRARARESSTALSSPTGSTSPRALDDLEPFRDLFYKPGGEGPWSAARIRSSEGLRALARRRSSSLAQADDDPEAALYGPQLDGVQEVQLGPSASPLPGLNNEALHLATPMRGEYPEAQSFPEDIESSRASSVIEPAASHDSHEDTLRLGSVPLSVAETTQSERRQSTALSFGDTEDGASVRPNRDTFATVATTVTASSLGIPANVEDLVRTSFVTTTSSTSRMSNLIGDFPVPPLEGIVPPSAAVLQSYFTPSVATASNDAGDSRIHSHVSDAVSE